MAEARRRPRPGVLHPTATDEKEDVGLRGEFVNVEDVDDIQDPDADDVDQDTSLRPDIQYKPILHVASNDLFDIWCIAGVWAQVGQVPAPNVQKNSCVNMVEHIWI